MDVDIICKFLKINKGGGGGGTKSREQGSGNREQEKPGGVVVGHGLIVRRKNEMLCNCRENRCVWFGYFLTPIGASSSEASLT
jgi:hypothetical protein